MNPEICDHPRPGPQYWDWRCLNCDQPIDKHRNWFQALVEITKRPRLRLFIRKDRPHRG